MDLNKKFAGFKNAERPSVGLALIFDVSGFTNFFNKPDIQDYITHYINQLIDCVETCIWGGSAYWLKSAPEIPELIAKPSMRKFLGDGMLYVWEDDESKYLSNSSFKTGLLNRLWTLQQSIKSVNKELYEYIPTGDLPSKIKFGIAQGTVYKLVENENAVDYIGPCINLASRLVKYCQDVNFIVSARLNISKKTLQDSNYMKVIALELRSFEKEIIIIDKYDFSRVDGNTKEKLFESLEGYDDLHDDDLPF